jgi:hypothetical protein
VRAVATGHVLIGAALAGAAALSACGGSDPDLSACELLRRDVVARQVERAGGPGRLSRTRSDSLGQSICRYSAPGTGVGLNLDTAPQVRRRYFDRVTEALQFSRHDPGRRPRPVQGLGDDDALGPAGAYWIPAYRQLFVLRGTRQFVYQFSLRGIGPGRARAAALRIAAATLPGERVVRRAQPVADGARRPELLVSAPRSGAVVRARSVVVRGTISGEAGVRVQGRRAAVSAGTFARRVALPRGVTQIRVTAGSRGRRLHRTVTVRRGRSPAALGAAFARRRPGRMPDVLAQPLADARALLRAAGIAARVVRLAEALPPGGAWAVCATRPAPGQRLTRGAPAVLRVDAADPFRTSGTACARK